MDKDLQGKVILLTGATEGIGRAAAGQFAARGASLTIVGRNAEKTARVLAELKAESSNEQLASIVADLSQMSEVRRVAKEFRARHERLDVLANNAGAVFTSRQVSADGLEMTFALNHVGYFLLTSLLLDLLQKTPGARVVSTSSGAHMMGKIDFDDIARREKGFSGWGVYGSSKLANILFTRELARRLKDSGATANCLHPGFVQTRFALNNQGLMASAVKLTAALFARSPEKGAETLVWLATSPEAANVSGEYFHDRKVARTAALARDDALAAKLWEFSEKLCAVSA